MPRLESTISPVPYGAGRSQDWTWPDIMNTTPGAQARSRGGIQRTASTSINGTASITVGCSRNVDCAQLRTGAALDVYALAFDTVLPFNIITATGHNDMADTDDYRAYRFVVRMAGLSGTPPVNDNGHDYGCCVTLNGSGGGGAGGVLKDSAQGWLIQIVDGTTVKLFTRGPNGLVVATVATLADTANFHTYDMRFVSASATVPASFQLLIDNVPVTLDPLTASWAAGTNNPSAAQTGTAIGFIPRLINFSGNVAATALFVNRAKIIAAPDIANTL